MQTKKFMSLHSIKFFIFILVAVLGLVFGFAGKTQAAPTIGGVSGTIENGGSVTVGGNGFGTNATVGTTDLQWLGDNIEAGTEGGVFAKTSWANEYNSELDTRAVPRYDNAQAHSGSQSIVINYDKDYPTFEPLGRYSGYFYFNRANMSKVYITYWTRGYWDGVSNGQWKQIRIQRALSAVNSSGGPGFYLSKSKNSGNLIESYVTAVQGQMESSFVTAPGCSDSVPLGTEAHYMATNELAGNTEGGTWDKWYRYEIYAEEGTPGNTDGTLIYRILEPGVGIRNAANYNGCLRLVGAGVTEHFNYILFGHYVGENFSDVIGWWDDVFVQVGTQARVEIGDAPTWNACTHREIQIPTAWATGEITVTSNQGSFDMLAGKYLYVVNADGTKNSNGFLLTNEQNAAQSETATSTYSAAGALGNYTLTGAAVAGP